MTHDQEEAFDLADKVVIFNRGLIEQVGTWKRGKCDLTGILDHKRSERAAFCVLCGSHHTLTIVSNHSQQPLPAAYHLSNRLAAPPTSSSAPPLPLL